MRATYDMSIIVLLYLHWFRIKYNIQTIHKQTDHVQTGLNLDKLIWDELDLVQIDFYTIKPVHVFHVGANKNRQNLRQIGFWKNWIRNGSTCL